MNREKYLKRICVEETALRADWNLLKTLQRKHLLSVPFENLDIHWGITISIDLKHFYKKIVENGRGGFCYELNGIFNELLTSVGFTTKIISARVANNEGKFGEEYDHLAIIVKIESDEYLVDVGFGDFSVEPILLKRGVEQNDPSGVYRILEFEKDYLEVQKKSSQGWKRQYTFKNLERELKEFAGMCFFNQTSSESHFTKGKLCSILTAKGRKTLTYNKFIVTNNNGFRKAIEVVSNQEFDSILKGEFGIAPNN